LTEPNDELEQVEVEVRVHRVRRRRSESREPVIDRPPNARNWLIYAGLAVLCAALMFEGHLSHRPRDHTLPKLADVTDVRSSITPAADSLQIVVSWDLTLSTPEGQPDSIRISVVPAGGQDSLVAMRAGDKFADTATIAAPAPGQSLSGRSCVAAVRAEEVPLGACTPWQYVRPTAQANAAAPQTIVIQPSGLQVDPDIGGKCAQWQQSHPGRSVWILTNRTAVPACMGANGKPTVAQFCAFMVLPDGRRVKTANSANNDYCDELFEEWIRERYS
jgi:hypothetical protein